jgi:hypothetical protein
MTAKCKMLHYITTYSIIPFFNFFYIRRLFLIVVTGGVNDPSGPGRR